MNKIVIAGESSNVGKTTITLGIIKALIDKGLDVRTFKCGPDYIDPMYHEFITKKASINLDSFLMGENGVKYAFDKYSTGDISIVEGVMGLYDGVRKKGKEYSSTSHLSKIIKSPVILVIDGRGMSTSAAALVLGYKMFDPNVLLKAVIINNISSKSHYEILKKEIEKYTSVECIGYLKPISDIHMDSQHLGLIPSGELKDLKEKINKMSSAIKETVDLDKLLHISHSDNRLIYKDIYPIKKLEKKLKIGIAKDLAFNFYYHLNIEYLKKMGFECVFFSPLDDKSLPEDISGIYLGGGFPEKFASKLSNNKSFINSLQKFINNNGVVYAECGGLMYLTKGIYTFDNSYYEMANILDCEVKMTSRLQHFGYVLAKYNNYEIKGHEFHRSKIINEGNVLKKYFIEKFSNKNKKWKGGYCKNNVLAAYTHIHFYNNHELINDLVNKMLQYKKGEICE